MANEREDQRRDGGSERRDDRASPPASQSRLPPLLSDGLEPVRDINC